MIVLGLITLYCLVTTFILRNYDNNPNAFTGQVEQNVGCYIELNKPTPNKDGANENTFNVAAMFMRLIWYGYRLHIFGLLSYIAFITRVYRRDIIDTSAVVGVSIYTVVWVFWLLAMLATRFSDIGRVCSGSLLPEQMRDQVTPGYAVQQGSVLLYLVYHTLGGIIAIALIAGIAMFVCEMYIGTQI